LLLSGRVIHLDGNSLILEPHSKSRLFPRGARNACALPRRYTHEALWGSADRWMLPIIKTVMQLKQKSNIAMAKPNVIDQDQEVLRKEPGSFTAALPWSRAASRYNDYLAKRWRKREPNGSGLRLK